MKLDPMAREFFYLYIDSDADLGDLEIVYNGQTLTTEKATNPKGRAGYRHLFAGPDAEPGDATVLPKGFNRMIARLPDNPEIKIFRFHITVG